MDFVTETDFPRIIKEHEAMLQKIEKKDIAGLEKVLKDHLYFSMKRMRYQIDVEYRDYFEEELEEGKFDIWKICIRQGGYTFFGVSSLSACEASEKCSGDVFSGLEKKQDSWMRYAEKCT